MRTAGNKKENGARIRQNIIVAVLLAVVVCASFRYMMWSVNNKIVALNVETIEEISFHDQRSIRNSIEMRFQNMEGAASELQSYEYKDYDEFLNELKKAGNFIPGAYGITCLCADGKSFDSTGNVREKSYLEELCKNKTERFIFDLNQDMDSDGNTKKVLVEAIPVDFVVEDDNINWLICRFLISDLEKELRISTYNDKGYSLIISKDGYNIIDIDDEIMVKGNLFDDLEDADFKGYSSIDEVKREISNASDSVIFRYTKDKKENLMIVTNFDFMDWYFVTTVPMSVFENQTNEITRNFVILLITIAVILIIIIFLMLRHRKQVKMIEEEKKNKEAEERRKLIEGITAEYNVAYVVNLKEDSFVLLRMDESIIGYGEKFKSFTEAKEFFIGILADYDKEYMLYELEYRTIRQRLAHSKSFSVEYRVPIHNAMIWHEMNVVMIDKDTVAIGFAEKDHEITKRHLTDREFSDYFALFEVDIDTRTAKIVIDSPYYGIAKPGTSLPYEATIRSFASSLDQEAAEFFLRLSDIEYVKKKLEAEDKYTYTYRSNNVGKMRWVDCTIYVTLRHEGIPKMFSLGFSMIDSLGAARQELQSKVRENMEIIEALASDYSSVYYIDIDTEKVTPYSMNEETQHKMLEIFQTSDSYPKAFNAYVENFVYEPDREMVLREGRKDNILKRLSEKNFFSITFRGLNDDEVEFCEMKFVVAHRENGEIKSLGLGFMYKDDEIMAQYINEKLVAEYISAFMVDLDNDKYRTYRHPNTTKAMDREDRVWSLAMADFAAECDSEYFEMVKNIGNPEFLRQELMDVDRREYLYRFPSATKPWRRSVVQVLDRTNGVPSNIVATFMGIDDYQSKINDQKKQLEEQQSQLKEALVKAQAANESKTNFLFNMSHDIRTPMNAILGFTGMAQKNLDDKEKIADCLEKTQKSGKLLLTLINSVLDMSRIESGGAESDEQAGDVLYSFASIESTLREVASSRDINISFEFGDIKDRFVYADFTRCLRIFTNLISNSIKYTKAGGYVKVRCEQVLCEKEGCAAFKYTIEDNGIGMSEEFQQHMFEAFTRERNSTTSGIQGTGLGLSVCKTFVDYLGGTIECESKLNVGTKFTVTLPFRIQSEKKYTDPLTGEVRVFEDKQDAARSVTFKNKKVLLVEDNEMNREIAVDILEDEGFIVEEAENGQIAVNVLKKKGPKYYDFILMDIQMPVMDGYEATKQIRNMYPKASLPIIALSANAFDEDRKASKEAGMNDHVSKPIELENLKEVIAKYL